MSESNATDVAALRVRYDAEADAMYLRLRDGSVADTVEIEQMVYVDVDDAGHPLGIEFVVASDFLQFLSRRGGEFSIPQRIEPAEAGVVR